MFIEEGVMNFWAMWGALGACACSGILLFLKIYEHFKRRRSGSTESNLEQRVSYLEAKLEQMERTKK